MIFVIYFFPHIGMYSIMQIVYRLVRQNPIYPCDQKTMDCWQGVGTLDLNHSETLIIVILMLCRDNFQVTTFWESNKLITFLNLKSN